MNVGTLAIQRFGNNLLQPATEMKTGALRHVFVVFVHGSMGRLTISKKTIDGY